MAKIIKGSNPEPKQKKTPLLKMSGRDDAILRAFKRRESGHSPCFRFVTSHTGTHAGHYSYEISELDSGVFTFVVRKSSNPRVDGITRKYPLIYDLHDEMNAMKQSINRVCKQFFADPENPWIKVRCKSKVHLISVDETETDVFSPDVKHVVLGQVSWVKIIFKVAFNATFPTGSLFDMSEYDAKVGYHD